MGLGTAIIPDRVQIHTKKEESDYKFTQKGGIRIQGVATKEGL